MSVFHKLYNHARFFITSFIDKDLTFYAASLSFYTIFTMIPLLLIVLTLFTSMPSFSDYYVKMQEFIFSKWLIMTNLFNQANWFQNKG